MSRYATEITTHQHHPLYQSGSEASGDVQWCRKCSMIKTIRSKGISLSAKYRVKSNVAKIQLSGPHRKSHFKLLFFFSFHFIISLAGCLAIRLHHINESSIASINVTKADYTLAGRKSFFLQPCPLLLISKKTKTYFYHLVQNRAEGLD